MATATFNNLTEYPIVNATLPVTPNVDLGILPSKIVFYEDVNPDYLDKSDSAILHDEKAIKSQIKLILSTPIGSEYFEPSFGSLLPFKLFEPINSVTAWLIENDTIGAVSKWMKNRISLSRNGCRVQEYGEENSDLEGYRIMLTYTIIKYNVVRTYNLRVFK